MANFIVTSMHLAAQEKVLHILVLVPSHLNMLATPNKLAWSSRSFADAAGDVS
jgi:hypothetical protein